MPASLCCNSCELDVFDAAVYFSGSLDCGSTRRPVGRPLIRRFRPFSKSQSATHEQLFEEASISKKPSTPCARLASFVNSSHQTKSKQKSSNIHQASKSFQANPPLYPNNGQKALKRDYSDKLAIDGWLAHQAKRTDGFLKNDRMWVIELPAPSGRIFIKLDDPVDDDDCDKSVCNSDLFDLKNYDI